MGVYIREDGSIQGWDNVVGCSVVGKGGSFGECDVYVGYEWSRGSGSLQKCNAI